MNKLPVGEEFNFDIEMSIVDKEQVRAMAFNNVPIDIDEDLMFTHFILNHEGSNDNHDIFEKEIMRNRAETAINKPIDVEHKQPIIGVITDARFVEPEGGKAYVECIGVIWKYLYKSLSNTIKEYYQEGKVRMSMENWFKDAQFIVGDNIYDFQTAYQMGICTEKKELKALSFMGMPCYRKFVDYIYGGVAVTVNPADKEAVLLAVASDMSNRAESILENPEKKEENIVFEEISKTDDGKIAYSEGFFEVYGDRFGIYNSEPVLDGRSNKSIPLKDLVLQSISILGEKLESNFTITNIEDSFMIIKKEDCFYKANYSVAESNIQINDLDTVNIIYETSSKKEVGSKKKINNSKGSEDKEMKLEDIIVLLQYIIEKLDDEKIIEQINQAISGLSEIKVDDQVDGKDQAIAELQTQLEEKQAEVERLNTELANTDTLKERAEAAEAELEQIKEQIAQREKEEAEIALANNRIKELEEAGIFFTDEAKKEKAFSKCKTMTDESFAEWKEEMLYIKAETEKSLATKQDDVNDDKIPEDQKAKASLNLEGIRNLGNSIASLWEKPNN